VRPRRIAETLRLAACQDQLTHRAGVAASAFQQVTDVA
jgi:hypothetical protein